MGTTDDEYREGDLVEITLDGIDWRPAAVRMYNGTLVVEWGGDGRYPYGAVRLDGALIGDRLRRRRHLKSVD